MPATSLGREVEGRGWSAMTVLVLLIGCALERPPGVVRVTYHCDQGRGFVARYERDGPVIVELGDRERVLPEVSAVAGTRYDDGTYELRLNGRHATLRGTAVTYSNCIARDWQEREPRRGPLTGEHRDRSIAGRALARTSHAPYGGRCPLRQQPTKDTALTARAPSR